MAVGLSGARRVVDFVVKECRQVAVIHQVYLETLHIYSDHSKKKNVGSEVRMEGNVGVEYVRPKEGLSASARFHHMTS